MGGSITVAAVGDVAPLWPLSAQAVQAPAWRPLHQADLAMANLELPLTTRPAGGIKAFNLRADPGVAASLRACGVDLVTVANNHAADYGSEGLLDTLKACHTAEVATVGGGVDLSEALAPVLREVGGLTVAVLGLATTLSPAFAAEAGRAGGGAGARAGPLLPGYGHPGRAAGIGTVGGAGRGAVSSTIGSANRPGTGQEVWPRRGRADPGRESTLRPFWASHVVGFRWFLGE